MTPPICWKHTSQSATPIPRILWKMNLLCWWQSVQSMIPHTLQSMTHHMLQSMAPIVWTNELVSWLQSAQSMTPILCKILPTYFWNKHTKARPPHTLEHVFKFVPSVLPLCASLSELFGKHELVVELGGHMRCYSSLLVKQCVIVRVGW